MKAEVDAKRTAGGRARKPPKAKVQAKRLVAKEVPKRKGSEVRQLEKRLAEALNQRAEALAERAEALKQQAATGEILRVIWASPTDVQAALEAVAERAALVCKAPFARVLLGYGDWLRVAAEHSVDGTVLARTRGVPLSRTSISGRAILDRAIIHYADILPLLDTEFPDARENARRIGFRAVLAVPLLREGSALGAIFLWRREPGLFAPQHVALVESFARQAARHRPRAPVQRNEGGAGAPDRDQRNPARYLKLANLLRCVYQRGPGQSQMAARRASSA